MLLIDTLHLRRSYVAHPFPNQAGRRTPRRRVGTARASRFPRL